MEPPWDNPRFRNWVAVARACHALERALATKLAPLGLKPAQLDVLMNLHRHPGMSQHDLARRLLVGRSNITMLLPQLETRGLLRREGDEKDKRILRLTLTATVIALAIGIPLGVISALKERTWIDEFLTFFSFVVTSIPAARSVSRRPSRSSTRRLSIHLRSAAK